MSKISLRRRTTLLMGALLLSACALLTALSIQNMTTNVAQPIMHKAVIVGEAGDVNSDSAIALLPQDAIELPQGTYYAPALTAEIETAKRSFSSFSYLYMAIVVAVGMFAAYYLAGRAMRPILDLNDEIGMIDANKLSKRIKIPPTKDEIERLAGSFNELLTRLEQDFDKEKRFSANAAHELKTPLATIMTSSQVLQMSENASQEDYRENLETTLQSARRLSGVVDGLLLLGGASLVTPFEEIAVAPMFVEIQKEIEPLYSEKNVALKSDLIQATIKGNPVLIYRAFFNLVENAFKYTEEKGEISITAQKDESKLKICVANTGRAIPEGDIENVFEPFYRADKSRSRKIAGAGLGLSIAKEIFEMHNAAIEVHSEKDSQTRVEVTFQLGQT